MPSRLLSGGSVSRRVFALSGALLAAPCAHACQGSLGERPDSGVDGGLAEGGGTDAATPVDATAVVEAGGDAPGASDAGWDPWEPERDGSSIVVARVGDG